VAINEILRFCPNDTNGNLLSQAAYLASIYRLDGNKSPPAAMSQLVNKALRQCAVISAGLGQFIADNQANDITDNLTEIQIAAYFTDAILSLTEFFYAEATGTANTIILTPVNPATSYVIGETYKFKALASNTGAVTINISGLGAIPVKEQTCLGLKDLLSCQIVANLIYDAIYDGSSFQILNPTAKRIMYGHVTFNIGTSQVIPGTSAAKIQYDLVVSDLQSWWSGGNFRFIPTIPGKYTINCATTGTAINESQEIQLLKNGVKLHRLSQSPNTTSNSNSTPSGSVLVEANGTTDYFELFWYNDSNGPTTLPANTNENDAFFQIVFEGA